MPLTFRCQCGQMLGVADTKAGKAVACPHCRATVLVPEATHSGAGQTATAVLVAPPRTQTATAQQPAASDDDDGQAYGLRDDGPVGPQHSMAGALRMYRVDGDAITGLAYGADHVTALVAAEDDLFFLSMETRRSALAEGMHRETIYCLALSPDCKRALSGDAEGKLMLWDVATRRPLRWLDGHRDEVTTLDFSPDGNHTASGGVGGVVRLWSCTTGEMLGLHDAQLNQCVSCVRFSPDGRLLLAFGDQGRVRLWSVSDLQTLGQYKVGCEHLQTAAFSHDGCMIIGSNSKRFQVCRWDLTSGERVPTFKGFMKRHPHTCRTWTAADGHSLLVLTSESDRGARRQLEMPTALLTPVPIAVLGSLRGEFQANDHAALSSKKNFIMERWDIAHENSVSFVQLGRVPPTALACSANGQRILLGFDGGIVRLFGL
jgi:hypothetical protein